ncbi:hypothetical protein TNCV_4236111 [Trichonephila clavipes]|nr:hypothetical protein TNCV_4236111 [Trichonephila clavipes]
MVYLGNSLEVAILYLELSLRKQSSDDRDLEADVVEQGRFKNTGPPSYRGPKVYSYRTTNRALISKKDPLRASYPNVVESCILVLEQLKIRRIEGLILIKFVNTRPHIGGEV